MTPKHWRLARLFVAACAGWFIGRAVIAASHYPVNHALVLGYCLLVGMNLAAWLLISRWCK